MVGIWAKPKTWRVNIHLTNFLMGDAEPEWASGHSVRERGEMVLLQPNNYTQVGENKQAYDGMRAFNWRGVEQTPRAISAPLGQTLEAS